jgi:O-acetyl-ADP-ribose deacetylase (regulator of RNase III)
VEEACRIALNTIRDSLETKPRIEKVVLVVFSKNYFDIYQKVIDELR